MTGLIPLHRRNHDLTRINTGFGGFYNMLDDFFNDGISSSRSLSTDTFKLDIVEKDKEYTIEAELPGVKKDEIELDINADTLCITVKHTVEANEEDASFILRERRCNTMGRLIHLENTVPDGITAKLDSGILTITIPKNVKAKTSRKIEID